MSVKRLISPKRAATIIDYQIGRMTESRLRDYTRNTGKWYGPGFRRLQKAAADELKDRAKHEQANRKENLDYWEAIDTGKTVIDGECFRRWIKYATEAEASEAIEGWLDYCEDSRRSVAPGRWFAGNARKKQAVIIIDFWLNV